MNDWEENTIFIKDVKSFDGAFINGERRRE